MFCRCLGSRARRKEACANQDINEPSLGNAKQFSYTELGLATDYFHSSNKLGRGGFGTVYKGTLKNGTQLAVKTLSIHSKQGLGEFLTEIATMTAVKHPNLVEVIGCCVEKNNWILVYEYVENNSLDRMLLGTKNEKLKMNWGRRSSICRGIAKGLTFLHEELVPHVVHRDIKASNILLDKNFAPKIGDFGFAKLFPDDITHITTKVAGTIGYLAPEYALGGQLTMKADVYSFGVLVLEIISGRSSARASWGGPQMLLLEWAWKLHEGGNLLQLVDPDMEEFPEEEVIRYIKVAFFCTQASAFRRPLMSQVLDMLTMQDIRIHDDQLTPPGFFQDSKTLNKGSPATSTTGQGMSSSTIITEVSPR